MKLTLDPRDNVAYLRFQEKTAHVDIHLSAALGEVLGTG